MSPSRGAGYFRAQNCWAFHRRAHTRAGFSRRGFAGRDVGPCKRDVGAAPPEIPFVLKPRRVILNQAAVSRVQNESRSLLAEDCVITWRWCRFPRGWGRGAWLGPSPLCLFSGRIYSRRKQGRGPTQEDSCFPNRQAPGSGLPGGLAQGSRALPGGFWILCSERTRSAAGGGSAFKHPFLILKEVAGGPASSPLKSVKGKGWLLVVTPAGEGLSGSEWP